MASTAQVERLFKVMEAYFAHASKPGANLTKKIKAVYQIVITNDNSKYIIDLKNESGSVRSGEGAADCTFTMKAEDFIALAAGKLNPQNAFMQGKLKIKGSIGIAMKFTPDVFPKLDQKLVADISKSPQDIVNTVLGAAKL
jgi:putative sterol carrier protein